MLAIAGLCILCDKNVSENIGHTTIFTVFFAQILHFFWELILVPLKKWICRALDGWDLNFRIHHLQKKNHNHFCPKSQKDWFCCGVSYSGVTSFGVKFLYLQPFVLIFCTTFIAVVLEYCQFLKKTFSNTYGWHWACNNSESFID